jgi:MFS family permease
MPGYFAVYVVFEIFLIPSAFARNFASLVITRFIGGEASSVEINMVGGTISEVWKGDEARSTPMSLYGFTSVIGIALGTLIGSAIQAMHRTDPWRWYAYLSTSSD